MPARLIPLVLALWLVVIGCATRPGGAPADTLFGVLPSATDPQVLQRAASALTPAQVHDALAGGAAVDTRGEGDLTALLLAASFNTDPAVVQALVAGGADSVCA